MIHWQWNKITIFKCDETNNYSKARNQIRQFLVPYSEFHFLKTSLISCEYKRNSASKKNRQKGIRIVVQSWNPKQGEVGGLWIWVVEASQRYTVFETKLYSEALSQRLTIPHLFLLNICRAKFHLKSNIFWIFHTKLLHTKITVYSFLIIKYLVLSTPMEKCWKMSINLVLVWKISIFKGIFFFKQESVKIDNGSYNPLF